MSTLGAEAESPASGSSRQTITFSSSVKRGGGGDDSGRSSNVGMDLSRRSNPQDESDDQVMQPPPVPASDAKQKDKVAGEVFIEAPTPVRQNVEQYEDW